MMVNVKQKKITYEIMGVPKSMLDVLMDLNRQTSSVKVESGSKSIDKVANVGVENIEDKTAGVQIDNLVNTTQAGNSPSHATTVISNTQTTQTVTKPIAHSSVQPQTVEVTQSSPVQFQIQGPQEAQVAILISDVLKEDTVLLKNIQQCLDRYFPPYCFVFADRSERLAHDIYQYEFLKAIDSYPIQYLFVLGRASYDLRKTSMSIHELRQQMYHLTLNEREFNVAHSYQMSSLLGDSALKRDFLEDIVYLASHIGA